MTNSHIYRIRNRIKHYNLLNVVLVNALEWNDLLTNNELLDTHHTPQSLATIILEDLGYNEDELRAELWNWTEQRLIHWGLQSPNFKPAECHDFTDKLDCGYPDCIFLDNINDCPFKIARDNNWLIAQNPPEIIIPEITRLLEDPDIQKQFQDPKKAKKVNGVLMGQIMKMFPGADPQVIIKVLNDKLK